MTEIVLKANKAFLEGDYETAAKLYHEGAREGDRLAAFDYGYCLWRGIGVAPDPTEAKSFFAFARDLPGGASSYNIALLYLHGEGVPQDFKKSYEYMRMSAEDGCIEAQLYMGMASTLGCMFEPDIIGITHIPYHKAEYRANDAYLLEGFVPDPDAEDKRFAVCKADEKEAFKWFRMAAYHKSDYSRDLIAKSQFLYAKCFIDGLGVEPSFEKGTRLMLAAGKSGSMEAVAYLKENGVTPEMILAEAKRSKRDDENK